MSDRVIDFVQSRDDDLPQETTSLSINPTPRAGRSRSTAVRYSSKAAADNSKLLLKANRMAFCSTASNWSLGLHGAVVAMQGWRKTMEDDHTLLVRDAVVAYHEIATSISSPSCGRDDRSGAEEELDSTRTVSFSLTAPAEAIIGIYDGHQNRHTAKYCRERLPQIVMEHLARNSVGAAEDAALSVVQRAAEAALASAFAECDEEHRERSPLTGGCTVGLVVLLPRHIILANLGDCRLGILRSDMSRVVTQIEHRLAVNPDERARVLQAGYSVDNDRVGGVLAVSRAMGDFAFKPRGVDPSRFGVLTTPDVIVVERCAEDSFVVVGCDGVWELQQMESIHKMLQMHDDCFTTDLVYTICNASCSTTVAHHEGAALQLGCDNISLGVLHLASKASAESDH